MKGQFNMSNSDLLKHAFDYVGKGNPYQKYTYHRGRELAERCASKVNNDDDNKEFLRFVSTLCNMVADCEGDILRLKDIIHDKKLDKGDMNKFITASFLDVYVNKLMKKHKNQTLDQFDKDKK